MSGANFDLQFFHQMLVHRFQGLRGLKMVLRNNYALEDSLSGRDIDRSLPLKSSLRRGMKIDMSMVFASTAVITGSCPRCQIIVDAVEDVSIQW
jgi:hypothetical protein